MGTEEDRPGTGQLRCRGGETQTHKATRRRGGWGPWAGKKSEAAGSDHSSEKGVGWTLRKDWIGLNLISVVLRITGGQHCCKFKAASEW